MTLQCARVAAAPWMAWPRLRAVEPSARPPRRLAGRASGRGTACFASGASGLEAAYPLLCCLASASSVAAARLQQRRLDSAEERPPPWQTVALSKAATALSILPFVNFLAWLLLLISDRGEEHRARRVAFTLLYTAPAWELLSEPWEQRSIIVALTGLLACPLHVFMEMNLFPAQLPYERCDSDAVGDRTVDSESPSSGSAGCCKDLTDLESKEEARVRSLWDRRMALRGMNMQLLRALARDHGIPGRSKLRKMQLIEAIEAAEGLPNRDL